MSKTPKSGEFLKKGSFIISGTKNFLQKPYLKIAIGVSLVSASENLSTNIDELDGELANDAENEANNEEVQYFPQIISAPASAISNTTNNYVIISPTKNGQKTSNLAKKILAKFISNALEEEKKWVRLASLDDIIRVIPAGTAEISQKKS